MGIVRDCGDGMSHTDPHALMKEILGNKVAKVIVSDCNIDPFVACSHESEHSWPAVDVPVIMQRHVSTDCCARNLWSSHRFSCCCFFLEQWTFQQY